MKKRFSEYLWYIPLFLAVTMILWVSIRQSIEYRINTAKWQNKLVTFDAWQVVPLECNEAQKCIESSETLISRFYNDPKLREFKEARPTRSYRIKATVSDIPGIKNILKEGEFSVVIPPTDTKYVTLSFFTKDKHLNKLKYRFDQLGSSSPIVFRFEKGNPGFPAFEFEDELEIDFHFYENGLLGTKNFPIGLMTTDFHSDFFNAVGATASKDKSGEVQAILGIVFVAFLSFFKRRQSSYLPFIVLLLSVFTRTVIVYFIENQILFDHTTWLWQAYAFLQLIFAWSVLVMYFQVHSIFLSHRMKQLGALLTLALMAVSLLLEKQFGFDWWSGIIWKIDPYFNLFPMFLVLWFGVKQFFQSTKKNVPADFKGKWKHWSQSHPEMFFLSFIFLAFGLIQFPVFVNQNSNSLPYSHAAFLGVILILKEALFYRNDQKLMIQADFLDSTPKVKEKIEELKQKHPMPYLAYLNQQKTEMALEFASLLSKAFGAISGNSAKVRIYQSPITDVLPYQEFLLSDFRNQKNVDLLFTSAPLRHRERRDLSDFIELRSQGVDVHIFAHHSLKEIPYFSIGFDLFKNASLGRAGDLEFLLKGIEVYSTRISLLINHVNRIFHENDPVLRQLGYQSILQVKSDFTFQRRVPALMIDVRGYSKLILQKELGCIDQKGNPVDLNHSQILNLLFKPFLDLAYKHKLTRIGPNGDSLILFGPVEQEERNKCTIMLKAALDARELYEMHLEEFKHQHQLHPDSHSKVTLQFGRALGFGEINVNLIGGSYTGQLDYHTETINLLARVEKFTKKMNTDFLITQDFLDELNQETAHSAQSGAALHDVVIRYIGSFDFDASAQKVKLYQAGYAHKLRELFSPSQDFDQAILNMDQKFYEHSLEFIHKHLALYPQDGTALAIQALCKTHLSQN